MMLIYSRPLCGEKVCVCCSQPLNVHLHEQSSVENHRYNDLGKYICVCILYMNVHVFTRYLNKHECVRFQRGPDKCVCVGKWVLSQAIELI